MQSASADLRKRDSLLLDGIGLNSAKKISRPQLPGPVGTPTRRLPANGKAARMKFTGGPADEIQRNRRSHVIRR